MYLEWVPQLDQPNKTARACFTDHTCLQTTQTRKPFAAIIYKALSKVDPTVHFLTAHIL